MRRARFTRRQRQILILMSISVLVVFGLMGFSVFYVMRQSPTPAPATNTPPPLSPLHTATPGTVSPGPSPTPSPRPTAVPTPLSQLQSARVVNELTQIVAGVRDLPAVEQIPVTFPTAREVAIGLLQRYQEEQPQQELTLPIALGLIPPLDPLPLPDVTAQAAHISSRYLPAERQILIVVSRSPTTADDERSLVRAIARALLDQQFSLATLTPCQPTTDAALALRALVEGDAVLTTARYANPQPAPTDLEHLAQMAADAEEPTYAALADNAAFARLRLFPYREGAQFVAALYDSGRWAAVNRAYARPPCSTEQVLHPERYTAAAQTQVVAMPDLGPVLGEGWRLLRRDTMGELLIGLHLASHLADEATAWEAADGWAGDMLTLWQREDGASLIAWRTAWDSQQDAVAFEQAYTRLVPHFRVPPLLLVETPFGLPGRLWTGAAGAAYLARSGRMVTVVWGADAETVVAVAEVLP